MPPTTFPLLSNCGSMTTLTCTPPIALAVLVLPFPLPFTCVDVYSPVTNEASTNRSATFEVLMVVDMMLCQTPVGMVCDPARIHGARLLEFAQTVTVVICAVAFELCARAMLEQQTSTAAVRLLSNFFMGVSNLDLACSVQKWLERSLGRSRSGAQITKGAELNTAWTRRANANWTWPECPNSRDFVSGFAVLPALPACVVYPPPKVCYNPSIQTPLSASIRPLAKFPSPALDEQDAFFASAFAVLSQAIANHAFPAASVAITHRDRLVALRVFGRFTYAPDSPLVSGSNIFDLASVSKVVATTSMAMILYERGMLDLEMPVVGVLPEFAGQDEPRRAITFRMLLAHSSGLPAFEKLFLRASTKEELVREALSVPLKNSPGTDVEYSDIGFILLGLALERIAEAPLDGFCQREVFGPLRMLHTRFNPPRAWKPQIPPTADDPTLRKRVIQGEVQDENASVMGGVAGHAGLFSTASDVATFAHVLLGGGPPIVRPETLAVFTRREASPPDTSRALGWDTPSPPSQSGKYFSSSSFGHLGYTGTSLWIDPERQLSVTLLTNRTWPDGSNHAIKQVRPRFHDAVVEALGASR